MFDYKIEILLQARKDERPAQDNKPFEQDYWGKLILKAHKTPHDLTRGESFELGRICQRLFGMAARNGQDDVAMQILRFTRHINSMLG